jgi:hypothetical protein
LAVARAGRLLFFGLAGFVPAAGTSLALNYNLYSNRDANMVFFMDSLFSVSYRIHSVRVFLFLELLPGKIYKTIETPSYTWHFGQ